MVGWRVAVWVCRGTDAEDEKKGRVGCTSEISVYPFSMSKHPSNAGKSHEERPARRNETKPEWMSGNGPARREGFDPSGARGRPHSERRTRSEVTSASRRPDWRGFTLVEMLVVLIIVAILIAISLTVASRVTSSGKGRLTEGAIKLLEQSLTEYVSVRQTRPPAWYEDDKGYSFPIIDGRLEDRTLPATYGLRDGRTLTGPEIRFDREADPAQPTGALFVAVVSKIADADAMIRQLDGSLIERREIEAVARGPDGSLERRHTFSATVVKDGWGNPIRFVHPQLDGGAGSYYTKMPNGSYAQQRRDGLSIQASSDGLGTAVRFSRSFRPFDPTSVRTPNPAADADEGICLGDSPYFYSPGADGNPGTRSDNVYSTRPTFPAETSDE